MRGSFVCLAAVTLMSLSLAAQRRLAGPAVEEKAGVAIDLRVNGAAYAFKGQAMCHHLATGSIYDTLAERWSVQQDADGRNITLTLWRPLKGGGDMVTLSIMSGGKRYDVNTVKNRQGTGTSGSGNVRLATKGTRGTFTVDAATSSGAKISGTVTCDKFTVPEVVAGN